MPVSASDVIFYPGSRINDASNGGGPPRYWPLPDNLVNNLFDDITPTQRATGYLSCRKVFPGLLNGDTDTLPDTHAFIDENPTESGVSSLLFAFGGRDSTRDNAAGSVGNVVEFQYVLAPGHPALGYTVRERNRYFVGQLEIERANPINVGDLMVIDLMFEDITPVAAASSSSGGTSTYPQTGTTGNVIYRSTGTTRTTEIALVGVVTSTSASSITESNGSLTPTTIVNYTSFYIRNSGIFVSLYRPSVRFLEPTPSGQGSRCCGLATLTAGASSGTTSVDVSHVWTQFVPWSGTATNVGPNPALWYPGTAVGAASASQVAAPIAALRPFNGKVPIFRRTGQVRISSGGTSEIATVARVGFDNKLYFTAPLVNSYPAGAKVASIVAVNDASASVVPLFSQRTWTRVFTSTLAGTPIADLYNGSLITTTNEGAVEQSWAVVFGTDPTAFAVYGSTVGLIATGTTLGDCAPINIVTGVPYFTLPAAGWIGTPIVGNCYRFDTRQAASTESIWVTRTNPPVASFTPLASPDSVTIRFGNLGTSQKVTLPWRDGTNLGGAGTAPPAPPNLSTNRPLIPPLSQGGVIPDGPFLQTHSFSAVDVATGNALPINRFTIGIEDGSVCWTLNAQGEEPLYDLFAESTSARQVRVTVDGIEWLFIVEGCTRSRDGPVGRSVSIVGRSAAMAAAEPYALPRNWVNDGATTAAQMCVFAQEDTGALVQWYLDDWIVPDKVWTFAGSPMALVQRVAEAAGAQVFCDRTENVLYVMPRYQWMPSEWSTVTPQVTIAEGASRADSFQRADRPSYNSVYVSGQQQGVISYVYLAGTDGAAQAPLVTDLLITEQPAGVQRGFSILAAGGKQARVSLTLPVLTGAGQPGVLSPNMLVQVGTWRGIVRAVSVNVQLPEVEQTIVVERHL